MTRFLPLLTYIETANKHMDQQHIREIQVVISAVKNINRLMIWRVAARDTTARRQSARASWRRWHCAET